MSSLLTTLAFGIYLLVVMIIGVYAWHRTRNATDYYLGGRNLPPWVAALSAGASDTSGWLLIGLPGYAYVAGLEAGWIALGLCSGVALNWLLIAKRLRVFSLSLGNTLTLPGYLQRRFMDPGRGLRGISAGFILLFFLFYVGSGLVAGGKLFNTVFGLPYEWAVWVGVLAIVCYTLFGGFLAVSWTDVFQGLLITLALIIVPWLAISHMGDIDTLTMRLSEKGGQVLDLWRNQDGEALGVVAIIGLLGWGLGYFGQPHILARFKALRSPEDALPAAAIAIIWSVIVYTAAVMVGLVGLAFFDTPLADGEKVFMVLVESLFHPVVAGMLLAAILAAIMSTADSQLLVCSSAVAEDLYTLFNQTPLTPAQSLKMGRWSVCILAIIAAWIAMEPDSNVLNIVAYAWAGLGAAFGPVLLVSLYWRRMSWEGAVAGVVVGGLTVVIWKNLSGGWFDLYELVPGFLFSLAAIVVVSLLRPVSSDVAALFDDLAVALSGNGDKPVDQGKRVKD